MLSNEAMDREDYDLYNKIIIIIKGVLPHQKTAPAAAHHQHLITWTLTKPITFMEVVLHIKRSITKKRKMLHSRVAKKTLSSIRVALKPR